MAEFKRNGFGFAFTIFVTFILLLVAGAFFICSTNHKSLEIIGKDFPSRNWEYLCAMIFKGAAALLAAILLIVMLVRQTFLGSHQTLKLTPFFAAAALDLLGGYFFDRGQRSQHYFLVSWAAYVALFLLYRVVDKVRTYVTIKLHFIP